MQMNLLLSVSSDKKVIATLSDWPEVSSKDETMNDSDYKTLVYVDYSEVGKAVVFMPFHSIVK